MYDEPARPSPTPAPIAPPARAMPPPMKAPAVVMSVPDTDAICVSLLGWAPDPGARSGTRSFCRSARERGLLLALATGLLRVPELVAVVELRLGLVLVLVVVPAGHPEVEDGQQREDEGLDRADEHVEELPDDVEDAAEDATHGDPADLPRDQRTDERQHDAAREDVAEEPQRQGDRLDELLEDIQREEDRIGLHEVLEIALEPLLPHPVGPDPADHQQRHRIGEVGVRGRARQQVQLVGRLAGDQLEPVRGEDEEEQRHGVGDHRGVDPAEVGVDLAGDLADDRLPDQLQLGRHVVLGVLGQLVAGPEPQAHDDHTGDHGRPDGVQVERPPAEVALDVVTDLDPRGRMQDARHWFFSSFNSGSVVMTRAINRKIASPNSTPIPEGQKATAIATATTVRKVSRTKVLRTIWLRESSSPEEITRLSQNSVARWLVRPSRTPAARHPARPHSPSGP